MENSLCTHKLSLLKLGYPIDSPKPIIVQIKMKMNPIIMMMIRVRMMIRRKRKRYLFMKKRVVCQALVSFLQRDLCLFKQDGHI
jgi:hypothetical protein